MKKILFTLLAGIVAISANAQDVVQVGAPAKTYSVTASGTVSHYHWSRDGGASTFINSDAATQSVLWDGAANNTYTLSIYPESNNGCNGATQSITVQIVNVLPVTVTWSSATTSICPFQATNNAGGGSPSMGITIAGAVPVGNWSLKYIIDSGTEQDYTGIAGTTPTLTFSQSWANASPTANVTHTIKLTQWTVNGSTTTPSVATEPTLTVTVWPTPSVSGIVIP